MFDALAARSPCIGNLSVSPLEVSSAVTIASCTDGCAGYMSNFTSFIWTRQSLDSPVSPTTRFCARHFRMSNAVSEMWAASAALPVALGICNPVVESRTVRQDFE